MSKAKTKGAARPVGGGKSAPPRRPGDAGRQSSAPPTVPVTWLIGGIVMSLVAALVCAWGVLCILFWQGSWQLLYHPTAAVAQTPASVHLDFESVGFDTTSSGEPQLRGWWVPASQARFTALYLHGATGNLGDTVHLLVPLHEAGLNVFAFDYRGYGQSHFVHPSEARWREDADAAIAYLTGTRHIPIGSIIVVGRDLGANLAVEVGAAHPDLAGVVLEAPIESPATIIFSDGRSRLVPARLLARERWKTADAAANLLIPSLWFYWSPAGVDSATEDKPAAYQKVPARKMIVWLSGAGQRPTQFSSALSAWLDELQQPAK